MDAVIWNVETIGKGVGRSVKDLNAKMKIESSVT